MTYMIDAVESQTKLAGFGTVLHLLTLAQARDAFPVFGLENPVVVAHQQVLERQPDPLRVACQSHMCLGQTRS